jgi:hypothetical protein
MFIFRRFMAERSIAYVVSFLTIAGTALTLPIIGMYYGLADWTSALTGGIVDNGWRVNQRIVPYVSDYAPGSSSGCEAKWWYAALAH